MNNMHTDEPKRSPLFVVKSAQVITAVLIVLLTPFSLHNFIEGRTVLGFASLAIILLCAINTWKCVHNRYQPLLILFGITPTITLVLIFAFREIGIGGLLWSYPLTLALFCILPIRQAWIANTMLFSLIMNEVLSIDDYALSLRFGATLLANIIFSGIFVRFISKQQQKLETLAATDPLTGLYNRSLLQNSLNQAAEQSRRTEAPVSLIMIDIDHFKNVNDNFGHFIGDNVLQGLGEYFQKRVRASDTVFRIGGEEFLILLNNTDLNTAFNVAEDMRKEIALLTLLSEETVTISAGIAQLQADNDINKWLKCADKNLYKAKLAGRNQVAICGPEDDNWDKQDSPFSQAS